MQFRSIYLFFILILFIFLPEGLGLPFGREISYTLILITPLILFSKDYFDKKELKVPKKITILYLIFLLFSAISTYFSVDILNSLKYLLLYSSVFLIFLHVYNHSDETFETLLKLIPLLSVIFIIHSLLITLTGNLGLFSLIPADGYQFVYSKFRSHNHLGDFLVLPAVLYLYYFFKTNNKLYLLGLSFIPFLLLSYSRSAYFSLTLTLIFMLFLLKKIQLTKVLLTVALLIVLTIFFFATPKEAKKIPILNSINNILREEFELNNKVFFGERPHFLIQSIASISRRPWFGVGPGNFEYVSRENTLTNRITESSHNLFIDILTENGFPAFIFFTLFILFMVIKSFKTPQFYSFLFLAILINTQTDYTHKIYSYLLLFFILIGLGYNFPRKEN